MPGASVLIYCIGREDTLKAGRHVAFVSV
jgi:hypothetical protein